MKTKIIISLLSVLIFLMSAFMAYYFGNMKIQQMRQDAAIWGQNNVLQMIAQLQDKCEPLKLTVPTDASGKEVRNIEFNPVCKK